MMVNNKISKAIRDQYPQLSKNQRRIADFVISNFDNIAFLNVNDIAENTGASVASVVRFAQRMEYEGYLAFREAVKEELKDQLRQRDLLPHLKDEQGALEILTKVANHDIDNIAQTLKNIDQDTFENVIGSILNAGTITTVGIGISNLLSSLLTYELRQIGLQANALTAGTQSFREQALGLDGDDLLIAFSFPPYSKETIDLLKFVKARDVPILTITDVATSPSALMADTVVEVTSKNYLYTNSISAVSVLINAVTTECARRNVEKTEAHLRALNEIT